MTWTRWIRRAHRWVSVAFTLAVIANLVALALKRQEAWIGLLALIPLIPLLFTGLYLFLLPYLGAPRRAAKPLNPSGATS